MQQNQNLQNGTSCHREARLRLIGNRGMGKLDPTKLWPDDTDRLLKAEREKLRDMLQQALREAYEIQSQTSPTQ